jgi:hypothetical protein
MIYRTFIIAVVLVFTYGCSDSNNNDFYSAVGSDGGLDAVDPNAGTYPNIQVIQPFLSGAIDPIKVQYWDQTYYWGPDSDGNDACFKGTVGIEDSSNLAQETAPGAECPTSLGQVTPCNPAAAADTVASGAVQPAISGCERGGAACTDILVPGITDEVTCESTVRMADPIAAGAAWFQNIDAPGTKGGTASHWWYGIRADKTFDAEDGYGGTQIDYISDATNINIAASGGGSGPTTRVNNIYLCSNKDVVNPAESPDVCTLSSLFGSCGYAANGDPEACKINNIGLVDGAYNVFIRSATPSDGSDGGLGDAGQVSTNNTETIKLLKTLAWDNKMKDWVYDNPPQGQLPVERDQDFRKPIKQINSFTVFGDWLYQCLPEEHPDKRYLEYFMGTAYASENFIWNTKGLLPVAYKTGLPIIRGSKEYDHLKNISTWKTESDLGRQFPVLNSAAADTVIALVMQRMKTPACAIGFGQWQQTHVSGSILGAPWSIPVDTDQNPVMMRDATSYREEAQARVLNRNRHKFVLGPITWLSMALDIRAWEHKQPNPQFDDYVKKGREYWGIVHEHVNVNRALCERFAGGSEDVDGPFPQQIADVVEGLGIPNLCQVKSSNCKPLVKWEAAVQLAASTIEATQCKPAWEEMDMISAKAALHDAQKHLRDLSAPGGKGPSVEAINEAATTINRFYFGPNLDRVPFRLPRVFPVNPPVTTLPPPD